MDARTLGTDRRGGGSARWPDAVLAASDAATFLAGVWLVLSPYVFDQEVAGLWSVLGAGAALVLSGAAPLVERRPVTVWRPGRLVAGAWLIAAPFALGLDPVAAGKVPVGGIVLLVWLSGAAAVVRGRRS
ncbi:hypothetical protein ACIA5G_53635 [Amycolatopsis sp. NPDC051758]|uniref:SPW repeat domain-containing protein n=1 Tax=Amycolatopsis sp. NPDC051758 TaxID=3363935 RepID=UPI0037B19CA3